MVFPSLKATPILSLDDDTSCPMLFSFEYNVCLGSSFEIQNGYNYRLLYGYISN
jgi:hypothetical protein